MRLTTTRLVLLLALAAVALIALAAPHTWPA
jgi:hypothetical protein